MRSGFDHRREASRRSQYSRPFHSRPHAENAVSPDWMFAKKRRAALTAHSMANSPSNSRSNQAENEARSGNGGEWGNGETRETQGVQRRKRFVPDRAKASKRIQLSGSKGETERKKSERERNSSMEGVRRDQTPNNLENESRDEILELGSSSDSDVEVVSVRRPKRRVVVDLANGSDSDGD